MASLFERLGRGLGKGLEVAGTMGMEEQRQSRLTRMREQFSSGEAGTQRDFTTGERVASEEFQAKESALDRASREKAAEAKGTSSAKPDKVKFRTTDEDTGKTTLTMESGEELEHDPETDTYKVKGEGKGDLSDEAKGLDIAWGEKMANRQAGFFSGDESDFRVFKTEEKGAEAATQFRNNARKAGTLDEFNTEFAKKGWKYIQELAGDTVEPKTTPTKTKKVGDGLMGIFKDFEKTDYDGIANQILSDKNAPESLKKEARDYLKGAR